MTKILKISKLLPNFKSKKKKNQTNGNNNKNPGSICSADICPCPLTPHSTSRSDLFKGMLTQTVLFTMKLKSEAILFSGKYEENKGPSNTSCIVQLHFSPFDASCFRFHLLAVSCLWSRASRLHGQMGKDDIQPSDMIALSLIFFCFLNQLSTFI